MSLIAVSTGTTALKANGAVYTAKKDKSGEVETARPIKLVGCEITVLKVATTMGFLLDKKEGNVLASVGLQAATSSPVVIFWNNSSSSEGDQDGIEVPTGELYFEIGSGGEYCVTCYIED